MRRASTLALALARWTASGEAAALKPTSERWVGRQRLHPHAALFDATRRDGGVRTAATSSKPYAVLGGHAAARRAGVHAQGGGKTGGGDGRKASGKTSWTGRARVALFGAALAYVVATHLSETDEAEEESEAATVENWSGTKKVECERMVTPETTEELVRALESAKRKKMRPVGSALSPNGCAFEGKGMVSMGLLDKVVSVNAEKKTVTLQAGARVREVVEALRPHGLTLQNYASIREQQMGGFTQVGAHGTGATIPPVDDTVLEMKIVSPSRGLVTLSAEKEPELFKLAKCGIGALGVVAELTIQCVDAHKLVEHTWTATPSEIESKHESWLREHQHIRYMWIPHTDTVVVVASNPLKPGEREPRIRSGYSEKKRIEPLVRLLREVAPNVNPANMGFGQLRDELLKVNPLDVEHVKRVNAAEAEFWKRSKGMRVDWSDQILGFDCGGQQHVLEVAFPVGELEPERSADAPLREDLQFMRELREMIEEKQIPAHAPIEQRWTSGSSSPMSPAAGSPQSLHSWVGIITYLPTTVESEREAITRAFKRYGEQEFDKLGDKYKLRTHWAKIELPEDANRFATLRRQIREHYPVKEFNAARKYMDPYGSLSNELIAGLFKN